MRHFVCFAVLSASCATVSSSEAPAASPDAIVARFNDRRITVAEVDSKAGDDLFKLQEQLYEVRTQTAERIAIELLVEAQALKVHQTAEQWVEARLDSEVATPTEAQLRDLFEKVKSRLPDGASFNDVRSKLAEALAREARGKRARELFDSLKKEAGYTVVLAEPDRPRKNVGGQGPSRGAGANAKITIVEFADFQCPFCSKASEVVDSVMAAYPGQVRVVYRHFPLSFHKDAPKAAEASLCAHQQGKFWQYHDRLYAHQDALSLDDLKGHALAIDLDLRKFEACLDSGDMKNAVGDDLREGERLGVNGTPAFFVNGLMLSGAQPEEKFRQIIDRELSAK